MENLSEQLKFLANQDNNCKVLGQGSYSIVWDIGTQAYKLSTELTYDQVKAVKKVAHLLSKKGVNVQQIYSIDNFRCPINSVVNNIKHFLRDYSGAEYNRVFQDYANGFGDNSGMYGLVGITQQKIDGKNLFDTKNYSTTYFVKNSSHLIKKVAGKLKINLEEELNNNLDIFNSIPADHYTKFLTDGYQISKVSTIDNTLSNNYLYSKDGFYFIDVGGLQNTQLSGVTNPYELLDNILKVVDHGADGLDAKIYKKQLDLCYKLYQSAKMASQQKDMDTLFAEYFGRDNKLKQIYNHSVQNVPEKVAEKYHFMFEDTDSQKVQ